MIKTVSLTANQETEVILAGGCHCCIENRGSGVIYASKTSGIIADSDGVTAIDSGNSKVLRNIAQYKKDDNSSYDYYGKIYLLSDSDGKAEIQTANDLNFFSHKNTAKGGGTYDDTAIKTDITNLQTGKADKSDVYTKTETNNALNTKVDKVENMGLSTNDFTNSEKQKLEGIATGATKTTVDTALSSTSTNPVQNKAVNTALNNKVDKVSGKGLSTNDFTATYKNKLDGLENYDDAAIKSDIALNLSSIGMSKKNLLPFPQTITKGGITFTCDTNGYMSASNTSSDIRQFTVSNAQYSVNLKAGKYILSFVSSTVCTNAYGNIMILSGEGTTIASIGQKNYANKTSGSVEFTLDTEQTIYVMSKIFDGVTAVMIRYADITDDTYEPYQDDLQTQINAILARLDSAGI